MFVENPDRKKTINQSLTIVTESSVLDAAGAQDPTHCVKSDQIRSSFWSVYPPYLSVFSPNAGKCGTEKTPYLDIFHAVTLHKGTF